MVVEIEYKTNSLIMDKSEELFVKHTSDMVKELNSNSMLPFIRKKKVLMRFLEYTNEVKEAYRRYVEVEGQNVLCRLEELDKLYEEREKERMETFLSMMEEMKRELVKMSRDAFCKGVCKHFSSVPNAALCYCARRQRFLKSLEDDVEKFMKDNNGKITEKFKDVSWKRRK